MVARNAQKIATVPDGWSGMSTIVCNGKVIIFLASRQATKIENRLIQV